MYPHERSLVKRLAGKPFVLVGVNSDKDKEALKEAMEKEKITWRSFFDGGKIGGPIATEWKVRGWPTMFVIDSKGLIHNKFVGSPGNQKLDEIIDELVKVAEEKK